MTEKDDLHNRLIDAGVLLLKKQDDLSVPALCKEAGCSEKEYYGIFDSAYEVVPAFYARCIPGFETGLPDNLEERLAYFIFSLLDNLEPEREWIQQTYTPFIHEAWFETHFRSGMKSALRNLLQTRDASGAAGLAFSRLGADTLLVASLIRVLDVWVHDDSEGQERALALIDRYVQTVAAWIRFEGLDLSFELLKYMVNIELIRIPEWVKSYTSGFFNQKEEQSS